MNRRLAALVSLPLLSLSASTAALADDMDNAPGSMCVGAGYSLTVNTAGQAENPQAFTVTAICPSERKVINGAFATNFSATVWVSDQSTTSDVCCKAVSRLPSGVTKESALVCTTGTTSNTGLTIPVVTDGYTFAHFYLQCQLPGVESGKTSRILTFRSIQS
ncbi:hypothetical protein [Vitiosangium sp. GDMCC 1.1324]|uniref:hypothetical protein n=1 Tax=Vitiosangium sp. (strain GDMCC 1.1324) TaxID=2138576 RepID=UPI000D370073|nr:hypothetical protein [Vitiosangium sp. GDMCC 1.1324]PTL82274.1 hypothetical protein DAT35_21025 [Vitiosangium sp. GDMCC 1.1324]